MKPIEFIEDIEEDDPMLSSIIYDESFTEYLNSQGCYKEYIDNLMEQSCGFSNSHMDWNMVPDKKIETIEELNEFLRKIQETNTHGYRYGWQFNETFRWSLTPQGSDYWTRIHSHFFNHELTT